MCTKQFQLAGARKRAEQHHEEEYSDDDEPEEESSESYEPMSASSSPRVDFFYSKLGRSSSPTGCVNQPFRCNERKGQSVG